MMRHRPAELLLLALLMGIPWGAATAGTVQVHVNLPVPERVDMTGIDTILVTRTVLLNDNPKVDLNREIVSLLKRELRKRTRLHVLDVEAPPLPEQPLDELARNPEFWKDMSGKYGADMILTGSVKYETSDRSSFVTEDVISPLTGQRIRRTRFADREGFEMVFHVYFLRGRDGTLLYDDEFTEDTTVDGKGNDPLTVLFTMFEHIESDMFGIIASKQKTESRILFTD
ncbi:MAG TPA: hypothetical protein VGR38_00120 [Candidatus Polarisedimenticolia bacterium]|nr:hypothetical protein [Candidatus Polarisedimenticolia bacterium]